VTACTSDNVKKAYHNLCADENLVTCDGKEESQLGATITVY